MNLSEEKILIILVASFAAVFSYSFIRRIFWSKDEIDEATQWYNKEKGWAVRNKDTEDTAKYIKQSSKLFGILALVSWLTLIYLLNKYY